MIGRILGLVLALLKLPIKIVLLPFRILSAILSLVIYTIVLAGLAGVVYFFVI